MEIELVPDRGREDPASRAAIAALVRAGLVGERFQGGSTGAWRRAGLADAIDRTAGAVLDGLVTRAGDGPAPGRPGRAAAESDSASDR